MDQTSDKFYLGIDPGLKGAIALINTKTKEVTTYIMPTTPIMIGDRQKNTINRKEVLKILRQYKIEAAVIERQWSRQGEGHVGAFTLGLGYGILLTCLDACDIKYEEVTAQAWRAKVVNPRFDIIKGQVGEEIYGYDTKQMSIKVCKYLYPEVSLLASPTSRTDNDGLAEAILMASYFLE